MLSINTEHLLRKSLAISNSIGGLMIVIAYLFNPLGLKDPMPDSAFRHFTVVMIVQFLGIHYKKLRIPAQLLYLVGILIYITIYFLSK